MCGRFYLDQDDITDEELIRLLDREKVQAERNEFPLAFGEIRPSDCAPVIAMNRNGQRSAFKMQWGYHTGSRLLINARCETAAQKPTFQESMRLRRCLIPASSYFEWDHRERPYQKYRFKCSENSILYLAGLYRFEKSTSLPVFTILTRDAMPEFSHFHNRMPVIIPGDQLNIWLDRNNDTYDRMLHLPNSIVWEKAEEKAAEQIRFV